MRVSLAVALTSATLALFAQPAEATMIPNGNISSSDMFNPVVSIGSGQSSYGATNGRAYQLSATGGFADAVDGTGRVNGTITFSNTPGTTVAEALSDFFVFSDGHGGTFRFSLTSVLTRSFADDPGITTGATLYLLGTTLDVALGYDAPTPTSLTLSFTSTGGSAYSSSSTLAVPPAPLTVPEPLSLFLLGGGLTLMGSLRNWRSRRATAG